jgi:hypothetical protein
MLSTVLNNSRVSINLRLNSSLHYLRAIMIIFGGKNFTIIVQYFRVIHGLTLVKILNKDLYYLNISLSYLSSN